MANDRYKDCRVLSIAKRTFLLICATFILSACACSEKEASQAGSSYDTEDTDIASKLDDMAKVNPDIFAWLYIPGTGINYPIAQNVDGDDTYYLTHATNGMTKTPKGGIYIESCNLMDMCDFNTVIHGKTTSDGDMFSELWNFADEEYFNEHDQFFIFTPDNTLTYEIWTAYEAPNDDPFLEYDFTEYDGCREYLSDMKRNWTTKTNFREGWEQGVDPYNFIVSLSTVDDKHPDKQWIVVGCLVGDAAGVIDRDMGGDEDFEYDPEQVND